MAGGRPRISNVFGRHFARRLDAFNSAILVFPLFMTYQLGILAGARGRNGVDFITTGLIRLCDRDLWSYLQLLAGMAAVYAATLLWLRRRGRFHPRAFLPMLLEASVYAFFMGALIDLVVGGFMKTIPLLLVGVEGPGEIAVVSAGAGLHEELVFRAGLMGGLIWLLSLPLGRLRAWLIALALSSLLFSLVHHLGPAGEPFTMPAFSYRAVAGVIFGLIYQYRGFAVAAWTHTLYDVFVFTLA